jgi:hypothetical protein
MAIKTNKVTKTAAVKKPVKAAASDEASPFIADFNGHAMLVLEPEKKEFPFQLGLRKLKIIVKHLDAVQKFVESEGTEC